MRAIRGAGYCLNEKCENESKGVFLLNFIEEEWFCDFCHMRGRLLIESGSFTGQGKFNEVRIEFGYDPANDKFDGVAIIKDNAAAGGSVFTLKSPLIRTDNRALRVGEGMLANLRRHPVIEQGEIPRTDEMVLSWDADAKQMKAQLKVIESYWAMEMSE